MKTADFIGTSMRDAFSKAKQVMGEDALILSSEQLDNGLKITVTSADQAPSLAKYKTQDFPITRHHISQKIKKLGESNTIDMIRTLCEISDFHQLGEVFCDKWLKSISENMKSEEPHFEECLDDILKFSPEWIHQLSPQNPVIFVGPNGAGKTSLLAKIAVLLSTLKHNFRVVTLDDVKASGAEQLSTYMRALKQKVGVGYDAFLKAKSEAIKNDHILLVDTPGVNILSREGMTYFYKLSEKLRDPLTLVMPADMDVNTASDIAKEFKVYNARAIILTKVDAARHYGSLIRPAFEQDLDITLYSDSSKIGDRLHPLNAEHLFELLYEKIGKTDEED